MLLGIVLWSYHLEKALHDSISRHFIRLLWLDQTSLTGTGMWRFLNGTLLYWTAPHCFRLYFTWLSRSALRSTLRPRLKYTTLYFSGWDWTGLDWTGQDRTALHGTGLLQLSFMDLGCSGWKYIAMYLRGWDWTGVSGTRLCWTREHCALLHWTAIDYAWLHQIALHCIGWTGWTGNLLAA